MTLEKGWLKRQSDKVEQDLSTWPEWMKANGNSSHTPSDNISGQHITGDMRVRELEAVED